MISESAGKLNDRAGAVERAGSGFNAPLMIVLGALALTASLYWTTSLQISDLWEDTVRRRYTHGWIVLAVTVWLIWRDRTQLASIKLAPQVGGCALVALGSIGWLIGFNAGLLAITMLAMPLLVLAAIWSAGGWALVRRAAFAVLFLYFAFPVWELISVPLQALTAFVSLWLTELAGIPVAIAEYVIHIPEGWFEIAGGCNGLHFFIVALGIAALHGEVDQDDWRSRVLLLAIAGTLALVTNWLRVFVIILAGHLTNMQHFLVRVDHYYFGWFLFAFALLFYIYLTSRVPRRRRSDRARVTQASEVPRRRVITATALSAAALALGPAWSLAEQGVSGDSAPQQAPSIVGWSGPATHDSDWRPAYANADEEFLVTYHSQSGGDVALYRAAYHSQRQGKELRGYGNSPVGTRFQLRESRGRSVSAGRTTVSVLEQLAGSADGHELLIWSVLAVDGRPDPMGLSSQLAYGIRALLHAPTASVIALAAECRPDCDHARNALSDFATRSLPVLLPGLESTGSNITSDAN